MPQKKADKGGFYAVRVGRTPGIYSTWDGCQAQVKGFTGAEYKKFNTAVEANNFMEGKASGVASTSTPTDQNAGHSNSNRSQSKGKKRGMSSMMLGVDDEAGWLVVYSDGACKGNGKPGSVAGVGVWWGPDDPRNIAERCPGDQTNNRAELIAILRVLEETPISKEPLLIKTDSQYSIRCFFEWLPNWLRNNWMNSKKEPVKNAAIIRLISAHLDYRAQQGQKIRLAYVEGHSGDIGNDGADAQANQGTLLPPVKERDWALAEQKLRQKMQSQPSTSAPQVTYQSDSDASTSTIEIVPIANGESPKKRQRMKPPQPSAIESASAPTVNDNRPKALTATSPPIQANPLAAIKDTLEEPCLASTTPEPITPVELPSHQSTGLTAIQDPLETTPTARRPLAKPDSSNPPSKRSGRMAAIQNAPSSSMPPPLQTSHKSPKHLSSTGDGPRSLSTLASEASTSSASLPLAPSFKRPSPNSHITQSTTHSIQPTMPIKSPFRILPTGMDIDPALNDASIQDYADCLLSDEDLAKEVDD